MENYELQTIEEPDEGVPFDILLNKIDNSILEIVTCPICKNIGWNIMNCSQCGSIFCKKCLDRSRTKVKNSCPLCRKYPFRPGDIKTVKKFFGNIKLKCRNNPCEETFEYSKYLSDYVPHLANCKYRKCHCKNEGCNYENFLGNKEQMKKHSLDCQHKKIKCRFCSKEIKEIDSKNHVKNECTQLIKCPICHKEMTRSYFNSNHNDADCYDNQLALFIENSEKDREKIESNLRNENEQLKNNSKVKDEEIKRLNDELEKYKKKCEESKNKEISLLNKKRKSNNKKN